MCRVRNTHTTPPWTTAYVCITIDDSCLDDNGRFVDKPMTVRMVQWQPYCVTKPFDAKTPVYVLLSTLDAADPSTVVAGPSQRLPDESANGEAKEEAVAALAGRVAIEGAIPRSSETISSDPNDLGDDINDITESRTFLAKVSCRSTSIHWLELAEYDISESVPFAGLPPTDVGYPMVMTGMPSHMIDPNQQPQMSSYYPQNMAYAQQQQNDLQSRQQYFYQMQQHQYHPHGSPGMQPPVHWQQQMPYPMMIPPGQQGDPSHIGATAGEAAAAAKQRAGVQPTPLQLQQQQQQQQHWAMYYPHGMMFPNPPLDGNGQPSISQLEPELEAAIETENREEVHVKAEASTNDDVDEKEPDEKRPRLEHSAI
jgi:hypothetical protein